MTLQNLMGDDESILSSLFTCTIENCWYIYNSFIDKRFSNGFTEGLNNKKLKE